MEGIEKHRKEYEVKFTSEDYRNYLTSRYESILDIFDDHIRHLKVDPGTFSFIDEKYHYLLENQVLLVGDKDDTNQLNRLRMEALTQSYYMFDTKMFSGIKAI